MHGCCMHGVIQWRVVGVQRRAQNCARGDLDCHGNTVQCSAVLIDTSTSAIGPDARICRVSRTHAPTGHAHCTHGAIAQQS
jgi:hypothetical protein